jgi:hypothetical protein
MNLMEVFRKIVSQKRRDGGDGTSSRRWALNQSQLQREGPVSLGTILLIILILVLIGALPTWGYSRDWGYVPSGGLGLVLLIVLILVLMGRV